MNTYILLTKLVPNLRCPQAMEWIWTEVRLTEYYAVRYAVLFWWARETSLRRWHLSQTGTITWPRSMQYTGSIWFKKCILTNLSYQCMYVCLFLCMKAHIYFIILFYYFIIFCVNNLRWLIIKYIVVINVLINCE